MPLAETMGAAAGGSSLYHAIFDYNHADWYVNEVLSLAAEHPRIACVVVERPGPTTKGDCLNQLYEAARRDGETAGRPYDAFVLDDAEDGTHLHLHETED